MTRKAGPLNDARVKKLLREGTPGMHRDPGQVGLFLRIRPTGNASWTFRYRSHGRDRWMDLGDPRDTSLAAARKAARTERSRLDAGQDPLSVRRAEADRARMAGTFRELAEDWYRHKLAQPSRKGKPIRHPEIIRRALDKYLLPKLGRLDARAVRATDIRVLLNGVRKQHPALANDLLRHLKAIYAFGVVEDRIDRSPATALTTKEHAGGEETARSRSLSRDELGRLFAAMQSDPSFGGDNLLIVRLLLALCVRKGELLAARWEEFDLDGESRDGPVWRLPGERTKTGAALDIPLAAPVVGWLRTAKILATGSDWVFPARRRDPRARSGHVGMDTINVALSRLGHNLKPFTVHDLRRTARTHLAALGVPPHVAELCLNHKPSGIQGTYDRHSYFVERRVALEGLATLLEQIEAGNQNVTPIRQRMGIS